MEKAVLGQIRRFITETNQINPDHHGGRSEHSTTTCIVEMMEKINEALEAKLKVALLAVDLSAAYDLCQHDIIIQKCRLLSMGKNTVNWIGEFLKDRSQYVEIGGYCSQTLKNGSFGLVQGGPSSGDIFTYYLNDLPAQVNLKKPQKETIHSNAKDYIDDLNVIAKGKDIKELLQNAKQDYLSIYKYLVNHSMAINTDKTQLMVINPPTKGESIQISINDILVKHQQTMRILGINLTSDLTFDNHLWSGEKNVSKSMHAKIALMKTVKPFVDQKSLANIGASLINSTVLYGAPVWGCTTQQNLDRIQKIQIKAARLIVNESWNRKGNKSHRKSQMWQIWRQIFQRSNLVRRVGG